MTLSRHRLHFDQRFHALNLHSWECMTAVLLIGNIITMANMVQPASCLSTHFAVLAEHSTTACTSGLRSSIGVVHLHWSQDTSIIPFYARHHSSLSVCAALSTFCPLVFGTRSNALAATVFVYSNFCNPVALQSSFRLIDWVYMSRWG